VSRVRVRFYATFRPIVGGRHADLTLPEGATLRDLLEMILTRWPELREHLVDDEFKLSKRANLLVDGRPIRFLPEGLDASLDQEAEIDCFPAVAGG
jgi:molybdopterin synthase sulfur carrier subunit